jgi:uncharacterized protein
MALIRPRPRMNAVERPFWDYVQRRQLHLQRCRECARFRYPPSPVCPDCLADAYSWEPIAGEGRLLSWVVFHRSYFPELPVPYWVVAAELPEGPILIANLLSPEGISLELGKRLALRYEPVRGEEGTEDWLIYQWEAEEP